MSKNKTKFINNKTRNWKFSKLVFFILVCFIGSTSIRVGVSSTAVNTPFPRKANYFLNWTMTEAEAKELARWDLLILDMEQQVKSRALLKQIRYWNPNIIILAYITSQEIRTDASNSFSEMRKKLVAGINPNWYLKNSQGKRLSWWSGTYLLNITNEAPVFNGQTFNEYLASFVVNEILSTGLWDGVFYDNAWDNITWFAGSDIDLDNNGKIDVNVDYKWKGGMKALYNETRRLANKNYIIVGNSDTPEYTNELNGTMLENFSNQNWSQMMPRYEYNNDNRQRPVVNVINSNTANTGKNNNYQAMRFGMVSTLLEDGYYSFDHGDQNHGQTWWYDEYNIGLGEPLSGATSQNNFQTYKPDIWQRDFANGTVLLNSTPNKQTILLDGEYEKIHGEQDTKINDGSIVSQTVIDGYDGLVLLKIFSSLDNVLFTNGFFVRFFDKEGNRTRNGFFIFNNEYRGGDKVAFMDLDGNDKKDLLVISGNKMMAWRDDGQIFMKVYPYTASYKGELRVSVGDLNKDKKMEIYVAPSQGYPAPIKVYTRHGRQMKLDWYPFGVGYTGGYSIAVAEESDSPIKHNSLVVAKASQEPRALVFDYNYNLAYQWLAFSNKNIGLNVGAGDLDGDKVDEIVVGAGQGGKPVVRVFNKEGKQLYNEFEAYSSLGTPGIEVMLVDTDNNGVDEIVTLSSGF